MSTLSEKQMNKETRTFLNKQPGIVALSIETGNTAIGVPDLYVRTKTSIMWIELKVCNGVNKPSIVFQPGQLEFLIKNKRFINCYVLLLFNNTLFLLPSIGPSILKSIESLRYHSFWYGKKLNSTFIKIISNNKSVIE